MKAAVHARYGTPEVVEIREIEKPTPTADQVLVRVHAASVNRGDLDGLTPRPQFVRVVTGVRAPRNERVGLDAAGVVESVGPAVTRFKPGDRVFGDLLPFGAGAFAEYVCPSEKAFLPIPDSMSFEDAATLPHAGILAVQALRLRSGRTIKPGDRVLIDGASGNVGPFAVQIAKSRGAVVTGVASGSKLDFVRSLGADEVLDYARTDYTKAPARYDWIVDVDSHHPIREARRALRRGGAYVTLGGWDRRILAAIVLGALLSRIGDKWSGLMLWWKPFNPDDVATLTSLIAEGRVKPAIDRRFPLDEIVGALRWVNDGHAMGKVIVTI